MSDPEFPQNPMPSLAEVTAAYLDVLKHNSEHTGFGPLAAMIKSLTEGNVVDSREQFFDDSQTLRDMDTELQDVMHSDMFLRVGIRITPFQEALPGTGAELVPTITNTALYTEFLSGVLPEDLEDEESQRLLIDVIDTLSETTALCFDPDIQQNLEDGVGVVPLTEVGEDALRSFVAIDPEYVRLGLDGTANSISPELAELLKIDIVGRITPDALSDEYLAYKKDQQQFSSYRAMVDRINYWGRNLLPEYIEAEKGHYLDTPDDSRESLSGPSRWHIDGDQYRWGEALSFLDRLDQDQRTHPFATEVREALTASVDDALDYSNRNEYYRPHILELENIRRAISGETFDEDRLEAYTEKKPWQ